MLATPYLALGALVTASTAYAQATINGTYITGLVNVLQTAGLTQLATVAQSAAETPGGQALLSQISVGQKTLFAPNNQAFNGVPSNITSNSTLVGSILTYHLLSGSFPASSIATFPNVTIARTFLSDPALVQLEGNKTQAIAFAVDPDLGATRILNQNTNVTITNTLTYENLLIHVVDAVIDVPGDVGDALEGNDVTTVATVLSQANLLDAVEDAQGITIFAPVNEAFANISSTLQTLNQSQIVSILGNHVINGTTIYSTLLTQGSYTSAAGSPFTFAYNSSGVFVTSGAATAQIVQSDIIIENGVVHLIDRVLVNNNTNVESAQSAYNSYTSQAAAAATQSQSGGAIGVTPTETGAIGGTSVPAGSSGAVNLGVPVMPLFTMLGVAFAGAALLF